MPTMEQLLGKVSTRTTFKVGDCVTAKDQDEGSITEDLIGRGFRVEEIETFKCTCESELAPRVLDGSHEPRCPLGSGSDQLVSIIVDDEIKVFNGSHLTLTTTPTEEE